MKIFFKIILLLFLIGITYAKVKNTTKIACVGDSITYGAKIEDRQKNSYPSQLKQFLGQEYEVKNFGLNSSTVLTKGNKPYVKSQQYKNALKFDPDIVIIKLGTNDSKPINWKYSNEFISNYTRLITSFQKSENKPKIYICYPVKAYATDRPISDKTITSEVIPMINEIAQKTGVEIINLNEVLNNKKYYDDDLIHPNAEGARLMAKTISKALKRN